MRIRYFHVDAFTSRVFGGNPAGVCPLERWLPDETLQEIAAENNLSETAFFVGEGDGYRLRWFTPVMEVDLCGHATLASAFVLFTELGHAGNVVRFQTLSGGLSVERKGKLLELDFPARMPTAAEAPEELVWGLGFEPQDGIEPQEVLKSRDYFVVYKSQDDVAALDPDMTLLSRLDCLGVIATAPGGDCDFVSRFFAPRAGVPEDPVTGSAHCSLIPYWSKRLDRPRMFARQISAHGGELTCELRGDRVWIAGQAVMFGRGEIDV